MFKAINKPLNISFKRMSSSLPLSVKITFPNGKSYDQPTGLFINNEFVYPKQKKTFSVLSPSTEEEITHVYEALEEDIDDAVEAATAAFATSWSTGDPTVRAKVLLKLADLVEENAETLACIEALDNGKSLMCSRGDVALTAAYFRSCAGWTDKITGTVIETGSSHFNYVRREPIGVCGQIIPWNYPIQMFAWKVGPALAAGNTIVMKPAEQTPLSALILAELSIEAGFPPGVINIVNGLGSIAGQAISSHMDIDKIAFTGSTVTGRTIMEAAAKSNLKRVTLELGGKSPVVVFDNADIDQAVNWVTMGILFNQGQDCCAGSRLFLQDTIKDEFLNKLQKNFESTVVGDPFDIKTYQGPQVSKQQYDKINSFIKSGIEQGATLLTGGEQRLAHLSSEFKNGYFIPPTIFTNCKPDMKIVEEEIFGPVLTVQTFTTEEEVIEKANNTIYGLAAGVFSQNASQCMRMIHALRGGTIWCNQYVSLSNAVPFGGMKQSGFGRELGIEGLKEYTVTKAVHWNFGEDAAWPVDGTN